jgi:hypothetical protein
VHTILCLISCHNFPYTNLGLLFYNPISGAESCNLQCLEESCDVWTDRNQGIDLFRAKFTQLKF